MDRGLSWLVALALALALLVPGRTQAHALGRSGSVAASSESAFALARRYEIGQSVPRDYRRAHTLYCRAARRGDDRAFLALGWMYLNGWGMARNDRAAAFWLRKAAARGSPQAVNLLRLLAPIRPVDPGCQRRTSAAAVRIAAAPAPIRREVETTAQRTGVDPRLLLSVVAVESGFDPLALSAKHAMGLMQLLPKTAARFHVHDPYDESQNLRGGATYLRWLLARFGGDLTLALAAYNAGEGAVAAYDGVPPFAETMTYVERIETLCRCGDGTSLGIRRRPVRLYRLRNFAGAKHHAD